MIFISYSSKDGAKARSVKQSLESADYECWMAPESISAGEDYADAIPSAILACDIFLLVLTQNALESKYVKKELKLALKHDKHIVPAKIENCKLTSDFEFLLIDTQIINIEPPYKSLMNALKEHYGRNIKERTSVVTTGILKFNNGDSFIGEISGTIGSSGTYFFSDGGKYNGEFKDGIKHGKGTYYYSTGNIYDGEWVNDKRTGYGTYIWKNGEKYEGQFVDGFRHGQGTYYYADGDKYSGEWEENSRTGYGVYFWANGDKHEGYFKDGFRCGKGTCYFANGDIFFGDWLNSKRHGQGKMTYADGTVQEGTWENDEFIG